MSLPALIGERDPRDRRGPVPLPRVYVGFRAPVFGDRRLDALDIASQLLAGGKGSRLHKRLVREERLAQDVAVFTLPFVGGASVYVGWATVRPGVDVATVEAAYLEELERLATRAADATDELDRAKALTEADELGALSRVEERADRLSMYATLFDDPRSSTRCCRATCRSTAEQIRDAAPRGLPRRQPGRAHVRARRPAATPATQPARRRHERRSSSSPSGPSRASRAPTSSRRPSAPRWPTASR